MIVKSTVKHIMSLFLFFMLTCLVQFAYAVSAHQGSISYTDVGSGTPIVLIHAFPTDQQLWQLQQAGLKGHFRVITLDLWGFGKSKPVDGQAISMSEYASEVKQLLDQLHIDKAIIGGESMGGYIALSFLDKYPLKVKGLILSNTQSIADSEEAKAKREIVAIDVLNNGAASFINGFMTKALSKEASIEIRHQLQSILEMQSPFALASALRGMALREDLSIKIAHSSIPILIITGDQDTLISPKQSEAMHILSKNSKIVVIPNAGHLSNLEMPNDWNRAVIDFFGSE